MKLKTLSRRLTAASALCLLGNSALADLTTIAQVGAPAGAGEHYVTVLLRDTDGGVPSPSLSYTLFKDDGMPANFAPAAQLVSTTNTTALAFILQRAEAAGFDNVALERAIDALGGDPAPAGTLAEKLSYVLRGEFSDNGRDEQKALLVRVFPQVAMACGAGWIGKVQNATPTTFELRETAGGKVAARVTTGTAPAVLTKPGGVAEAMHADPTGHLRAYLNWWTTSALRDRTPHICGYNVYRADRAHHISETGSPPPATLTPAQFEAAITAGLIVKVNACPVLPDAVFEGPPPADAPHFFIDDNDNENQSRFDEGGEPFADGQQMTYYVAACDYFGRPGDPSDGLEVRVCDRMPPETPSKMRGPVYEGGTHFVRLSWNRAPAAEVGRYFVYCYDTPQEPLPDIRHEDAPETPSHVATIDNVGNSARVTFDHTGPSALTLPADAGKTRWYCVRAEDTSSCIDDEGFGNLSLPCGAVYASLYGFEALPAPDGRLLIRCCDLLVDVLDITVPNFDSVPLRATRNLPGIRWVEFREINIGIDLGRHVFDDSNMVEIDVALTDLKPPLEFEARFGLDTGQVSEYSPANFSSSNPTGKWWRGLLRCGDREYDPDCEDLPYIPLDPDTGKLQPTCGEFIQLPREHSWRVFRRIGLNGELSLIASGRFADTTEWCDPAVPAVPVTLCYYGVTYDADGNNSPLILLGCRHPTGKDLLPVPDICSAAVLPGTDLNAPTAEARVCWFCPRPGVERFDLAVYPVPPGVDETLCFDGVEWGVIPSPRLPHGYGADGTTFEWDVDISKGTDYQARVRARGIAPAAHPQMMAEGDWSDTVNVLWQPEADTQNGVLPWPSRPIPAVAKTDWPTEIDFNGRGRVAIGAFPAALFKFKTTKGTEVFATSLHPFLFKPLPLAVYRHETTAGARHEMAQTSPLLREFWKPQGADELFASSPFIDIAQREGAAPTDPYYIWVLDQQPLSLNKTYRYTVTCFRGDGEVTGSATSEEFTAAP